MAENENGRAVVLSRLRGRYDRMRELLDASEGARQQPGAAPESPVKSVVTSGTAGLEAVLRAEHRVAPRPASTRAPRRVRA